MSSGHFGRTPNRKRVCGSLNRTSQNYYGSEPHRTKPNRDRSKSRLKFRQRFSNSRKVFHKPSIMRRKSKECTYISHTFRNWPISYCFDFFRAVGPPLVRKPHDPRIKCVLKSVHLESLAFSLACPRTEMTVFSLSNSSRCVLAYNHVV